MIPFEKESFFEIFKKDKYICIFDYMVKINSHVTIIEMLIFFKKNSWSHDQSN